MVQVGPNWEIENRKSYPKLTEPTEEADVAIIGGGMTGILNAYILSREGHKVVLLEKKDQILKKVTFHTTAFITKMIDTDFSHLVEMFGKKKAKQVWNSGEEAIKLIDELIERHNIDCEFKYVSAYTYAKDEEEFKELEEESEIIKKAGFKAEIEKDAKYLGFANSGVLKVSDQALFHPIKFVQALADQAEAAGVKIFTDSEVVDIKDGVVKTKEGSVKAKNIIIATYNPFTHKGTHFKKGMYRSYVFELHIKKGLIPEGQYYDMHNPYHYFRMDSYPEFDRMIVGGEDHREEIKMKDKSFDALEEYVHSVLDKKDYEMIRKWSNLILEPSDGLPLIGKIKPNVFVATAFSGNGMTYSAISAVLIRDLIKVEKNPYEKLYDPLRVPSLKQLAHKGRDYAGTFFGGAFKNLFK